MRSSSTRGGARAFRVGATPRELDRQVDALRTTISVVENGQQLTYPFDLEGAHRLYGQLFGPVSGELAGVSHLVFEPDGAMLRLPPNLLVMDRAAIDTYRARIAANSSDDGFDFRGVQWLGRDRDISTAVSVRAFRDVRNAPPSRARAAYLGFGQNEPARGFYLPAGGGTRGADAVQPGCSWSLAAWNRPISARELRVAGDAAAMGRAGEAEIVTGSAFTDTGIMARGDLNQYRILHFATHGLTAPPRPECPARPALMTSFGGGESDGLLSFAEIYDLRLDADLIILSACDTASRGSAVASAEAGLAGGGDYALDGLVRAFVGAGGRIIVASHWPVPDDFNATERLISGLFRAPPGTGTAGALRQAQRALMDARDTSHPYLLVGLRRRRGRRRAGDPAEHRSDSRSLLNFRRNCLLMASPPAHSGERAGPIERHAETGSGDHRRCPRGAGRRACAIRGPACPPGGAGLRAGSFAGGAGQSLDRPRRPVPRRAAAARSRPLRAAAAHRSRRARLPARARPGRGRPAG